LHNIDILSLTPKLNQIKEYSIEHNKCDPNVMNSRTQNIMNHMPSNEPITSTPKCNGSIEG